MNKTNTYIARELIQPIRFLDFVIQYIDEITTRNGAKKAIKNGSIKVNDANAKTGTYININDIIDIYEEEAEIKKVFELDLDVLHEDEYLAIINKPAGIGVSGNYFRTIQNALPFNIKTSSLPDKLNIPRPVHRLDNPTSGLLIIAKTSTANIRLGEMLAQKLISKYYHAIIIGKPEAKGEIEIEIDNKKAISQYQIIDSIHHKRLGQISLVRLSPITGRTHQLRIHMSEIGHPILGDKEYGNEASNKLGKGLFLSATDISFVHPFTNKALMVSVTQPNKFTKVLKAPI